MNANVTSTFGRGCAWAARGIRTARRLITMPKVRREARARAEGGCFTARELIASGVTAPASVEKKLRIVVVILFPRREYVGCSQPNSDVIRCARSGNKGFFRGSRG